MTQDLSRIEARALTEPLRDEHHPDCPASDDVKRPCVCDAEARHERDVEAERRWDARRGA